MTVIFASEPAAAVTPSTECATADVPFTCTDVWGLASFTYDPTLVHDDSYSPDRGSYAELIKDVGGFACSYASPRNGNRITIAAAKAQSPGSFGALEVHIAASSTQVLTFGAPSEIQVFKLKGRGNHIADYEIFLDGYWISVSSNLFHTPNGATTLIQAVMQAVSRSEIWD